MRGWQASMGALKCTRATLSMPSGSQRVRTSTANAYRHNRWKCTTDCDTITSAAYKLDLNWATSHTPVLYYVVFNQSSHRISARDRWWLEQHNTSEPCATPLAPVRNESSPSVQLVSQIFTVQLKPVFSSPFGGGRPLRRESSPRGAEGVWVRPRASCTRSLVVGAVDRRVAQATSQGSFTEWRRTPLLVSTVPWSTRVADSISISLYSVTVDR